MPEETRLFIRSFIFAAVVATIYWFVSYDWAGTVLLGAFSLASLVAFAVLRAEEPHRAGGGTGQPDRAEGIVGHVADWVGTTEHPGMERPFEDEQGRIPIGSIAPLMIGVGIALMALGLIFGVWSILAGAIPVLLGVREWIHEVSQELEAVEADDQLAEPGAATEHGPQVREAPPAAQVPTTATSSPPRAS